MKTQKFQATAPSTIQMREDDFKLQNSTSVYWLGSGGILINSRGTIIMIDPVICTDPQNSSMSETGQTLLVSSPIVPSKIKKVDAVLYTHSDYDHLGELSAIELSKKGTVFHGTEFVSNKLKSFEIDSASIISHEIGSTFRIGDIEITLTRASHSWQENRPEFDWCFGPDDCCGFFMKTCDGNIWAPGDSKLLDEHLQMKDVDLMFIDFSNDEYHFGFENSILLANTLLDTKLIMYHYGTYYNPDKDAFNANPKDVEGKIVNPNRLHILAPGEKYNL
ncbi:L-ascorbate metabolism protein UlaG (beta-lactamase superfamily) [Sedimentibacter acidaminivorans]|uniref:L-ascorbate metabolism protein UlaG (Beta-lactamase superfamily) n=1 Tax=Sedimentibacter acidaminivorans TaxID=913099 RepID=A0ABS4G959_9FIRM|nr:MBL fold metallo-hydrolase [Sedimentibacter acidaminivorans]MBP1924217.1 L-ascorbate metabolism protein UlaG (beta-lactamase superfamily) [Sedimentibacter acidaminivorans]